MAETGAQFSNTSQLARDRDDPEHASASSPLVSGAHIDGTIQPTDDGTFATVPLEQEPLGALDRQSKPTPLSTDRWGDKLQRIRQKDQARGGGIPKGLKARCKERTRTGQPHDPGPTTRRILNDYEEADGERFLSCYFLDGDMTKMRATMEAPPSSPYSGGVFHLLLGLENYPWKPPQCRFLTPIYHPNIDDEGDIVIDILAGNWKPTLALSTLLVSISSILSDPIVDEPLVPEIAVTYIESRDEYNRIAREMTLEHATPHQNMPEYGIGEYTDLEVSTD